MIIQSLLYLLASLTVFLILTEVLTIDISYGDSTVIEFNLMIFGIRFTKAKSKNKKGRKKRFRPDFYTLATIIKLALSKSEIILHRLILLYPDKTPAANAIKIGALNSLLSAAVAYADGNSKNFYLGNISFENSANNSYKIMLDASLRISLLDFLIIIIRLHLSRIKGVKRHGRKQNE